MLENSLLAHALHKHKAKIGIIGMYVVLLVCVLWIPQLDRYTSKESQALSILIFPEVVSVEILREFTKETGIAVYAKHVESDAEMCVCLNDSHTQYDAICIPEYLIPELKRLDCIQPIDTKLLPNYNNLHPLFKQEASIQDSIPFSWALFGLGVDTQEYPNLEGPSWSILFEKQQHKVCVSDDPRSLLVMGALALNYATDTLSKKQVHAIACALKKQKPHVEIYTDTNIALLFANNIVPLAFTSYNALALASKYNTLARFFVPREGVVRISQNWIISKKSSKSEMTHAFINFIISTKMAKINEQLTEFLPTDNELLLQYWSNNNQKNSFCPLPSEDIIKKAHRAPHNISPKLLSSLWITLKNT